MSITLKAARVNVGLTQSEFAKRIGVTDTTVRNYERGKTYPDIRVLERIKHVTGVGYEDLIFSPDAPVKPETNTKQEA